MGGGFLDDVSATSVREGLDGALGVVATSVQVRNPDVEANCGRSRRL
jgi:hypothetical protein